MKSLEKKNLQTGGFRSVMAASSPDDFRFVECSSPFSEISHASTAACSPSRHAACSSSPCSPSPEPECCTVYSSRTPALVHQRTESAQNPPRIKIECFSTDTTSDSHLIELDWSAAPRSSSPSLRDMEWTPATLPAANHPRGKGLWEDILPEANAVSCEPSGGTDVSSDSNAAGMLSMSDEELIASLAGCAAPAAQHTPHEEPHLSKSRTSSRAEVPAEQSIILHVDDEAAAPDSQTCCEFLHLEGCANDALREVEKKIKFT
jgi:hypothetical protein